MKASFLSMFSFFFSFRARRTAEKARVRESVSGGRVAWGSLVLGTPKSSFCCECDLPLVLSLLPRGRVAAGLVTFSLFLALEMRNFGNRGFLLRQLATSQSRKLPLLKRKLKSRLQITREISILPNFTIPGAHDSPGPLAGGSRGDGKVSRSTLRGTTRRHGG